MTFSSFSLNSDMGIMTALTIVVALIVDFLLLPALLLTYEKEKSNVKQDAQEPVRLATDTAS